MSKQNDNNSRKQGKDSSKESGKSTRIEGRAVNLGYQGKQPAAIPPKMELKPPKK